MREYYNTHFIFKETYFNFSSPTSVFEEVYAKIMILSWCLEAITTIINRFTN